jgi:phosphoribosylanthranilate isomerase
MSIFIKICGLRKEQHVNAAIEAGADALGFVFAKSRREIKPIEAAYISVNIPSNILRVAVMLHPTNEYWQKVLNEFSPDVLQADVQDFSSLDIPNSIEKWPVFREGSSIPNADGKFIFEGKESGQGETVDWVSAATIKNNKKMILAGGLDANNVARAINVVNPFGVDVSSGVESAPGQKDIHMIKNFVSAAKAVEKDL